MFELTVGLRNSKGQLTGQRKTYSSETGYGISCAWWKHVNSVPRKGNPKTQLPDGKAAEELLKEIYGD